MNTSILDLIYQPAIIVAIIGIIVGIFRYVYAKWSRRLSVNRALLSEISRLLHVVYRHYIWWLGCMKENNIDLPLVNFSMDVYDKLLKDWGDVSPGYAGHASRFYGYIKFINRLQGTRAEYIRLQKLTAFADTYVGALNSFLLNFNGKFDRSFEKYNIEKPDIKSSDLHTPNVYGDQPPNPGATP